MITDEEIRWLIAKGNEKQILERILQEIGEIQTNLGILGTKIFEIAENTEPIEPLPE